MPEEAPDKLLTSEQVADRLSVSIRTLWRLLKAGKAPLPVRWNRKLVRWRQSDVDKFIRELKQGSP